MKTDLERTIRNLLIALIVPIVPLFAASQIQPENVRKNVNLKNVTVQQLVGKLGNDFSFSFFITDEPVGGIVVSVTKKNATVREILDAAFRDKGIGYTIKGESITIFSKKEQTAQPEKPAMRTISGAVTDGSQPLVGAIVVLDGSGTSAITGTNGKFTMEVPANGSLTISYPGCVTLNVKLSDRADYIIVLREDTETLSEVVVVGYGIQRKDNLTGSVSAIKTDKLTIAPITNVTNMLGGQLSGLKTKQTSGIPGYDGATLNIRGLGSPLIIVDGVESEFGNIDASQIESVSILKDGAASIYGARGGNGVVLITLKRGSFSKTTVSLNSSVTFQNSTKLITSGSSGQRAEWEREAHINANKPASQIPYTLSEINKFYEGGDPKYLNTDWFGAAIRQWAPQYNANLSVSGGNDNVKHYTYFGYNDQRTISRNDGGGYKRFNLQSTADVTVFKGLVLSGSLNYILENHDFTAMNLRHSNFYYALYDSDPRYPLTLPDETKLSYAGSTYGNAVFVSSRELAGYRRNINHNVRANAALTYDIKAVNGLQLRAFVNFHSHYEISKIFRKQPGFYTYDTDTDEYSFVRNAQDPSMISLGTGYSDDFTQQYSVSYNRTFDEDHRLSAIALYENISYKGESFSTSRGNLTSSVIDQLFTGDPTSASNDGSASEWARASFVGRLNYSYRNRYLLETTFRADALSKFPKDGRWGFFPSVSLGWIASQENFLKGWKALDFFKLRASYGQSGYDYLGNYQFYGGYSFDMSYILDDQVIQGLYSTGLANYALSWERMTIYNAGIDFTLLGKKLYGTIEAFYRLREGIPGRRTKSIPSTFGTELPLENLNSVDTRGFEIEIGTAAKFGDFSYDISGNISWGRSKYVDWDEADYTDPDQKRIYGLSGKWTDERYGYVSDGLFTSLEEISELPYSYVELGGNESIRPGDVKYLDMNGDGKLDWRDQVKIGNGTMPNWMYGLNMNFKYKGFDLIALLQGSSGYTTYIELESAPTTLKYENRWTEAENNKYSLVPRPGSENPANWWVSDYRYHNAWYVRLKSVSIGYSLTGRALEATRLAKLRIYVAGTNIFTISNLSKYGVDPEAPEGMPAYYYPQQRTLSVGVSITY